MSHKSSRARRAGAFGVFAALCAIAAFGDVPTPSANRVSLDDFFGEDGVKDVAVSPSGRYLASIVRRADMDFVVVHDLDADASEAITRIGRESLGRQFEARISTVIWKTDERLLFRVSVMPKEDARLRMGMFRMLGYRLFSIDREGKGVVRLLAENRENELDWALNLGAIRSLLPRDPENILMIVDGQDGRSLFKVNVMTGMGAVVEPANHNVRDWWLDLDGAAVIRAEVSSGSLRFYRREQDGKWKKFHSVRLRELKEQNEYEPLGPSDQEGKFYVLARPEDAERRSVYLYDLANEDFGAPLVQHPQLDISSAQIARDGKSVQRYCYVMHVRICESTDREANAHMSGLRKYFKDSANIYIADSSDDGKTLLLFVEGPSDPPAYYHYRYSTHQISLIGLQQNAFTSKQLPTAAPIEYAARDGLKIHGYLTRPPGAEDARQLPLIVMPHGGPESRDHLQFDRDAQFFAAQGYAVFQPNFRGSDGFGRSYSQRGHGEWGRRMQDDITDGVRLLIEQGVADAQRICIVGASYGGYAALAGATLTPEMYRCAASIAGIADLSEFLKTRRRMHGADSELYSYWMKQIGDPERDAQRIAAVSPITMVQQIKAPILLVHGDADRIVPHAQSLRMKKQLDKSGRNTQLISLEDEGHSDWSEESERRVMTALDAFVRKHIGAGFAAPGEHGL
jgi:dipeptidyl aminopeptidase/acylaminoacyl peptidase